MKGTVSTLGLLGSLFGLLAAAATFMLEGTAALAGTGDPGTRVSMLTAGLGFLFGAVLWLPAGGLLLLAGLSRRAVCRPRRGFLVEESDEFYPSC
jgi:hypothetical protein